MGELYIFFVLVIMVLFFVLNKYVSVSWIFFYLNVWVEGEMSFQFSLVFFFDGQLEEFDILLKFLLLLLYIFL